MSADLRAQAVLGTLVDVANARDGAERRDIVRRLAQRLGVSERSAWRWLTDAGWESGRRTRADKGTSVVSKDALIQIGAMLGQGRNKYGEANIPMTEAHRIAQEQGLDVALVSRQHMGRLLARERMTPADMRAPDASMHQRTLHANHCWLFDISVGIQWYFQDPSGKRLQLYTDAGARYYSGKVENFKKLRKIIYRFVMVDHYSGAYFVRYYYTSGERAEDVVDFFWYAMAPKPLGPAFPFRGLPEILLMDQGSANKAAPTVNLIKDLGIKPLFHKAKNAKTSGAVEKRHHAWQTSFEGRLALDPAADLDDLNRGALGQCALYNAQRPHARHGRPPMVVWTESTNKVGLREAPTNRDQFFQLATTEPRTGVLNNNLWLRAENRKWKISGEGVAPSQRVTYRLCEWMPNGIRAWDAEGRELAAEELRFDEAGFATNADGYVIGREEGQTAPPERTSGAVIRQTIDEGLKVRVPGVWSDVDARLERQAFLSNPGTVFVAPASAVASSPVMGSLEAREEVLRRLGRSSLTRDEAAWWKARVEAGLTVDQFEAALTDFSARGDAGANQAVG